jgi:antitoxin PrlF
MALARVTTKGQVTIPAAIRRALNIEEGDQLPFEVVQGQEARIRVVKRRSLLDLYGALPATRPLPGKAAVREELGKHLGQRRMGKQP